MLGKRAMAILLIVGAPLLSGLAMPQAKRAGGSSSSGDVWEYLIVSGASNVNFNPPDNSTLKKESGGFAREDFVLEGNLDRLGKDGWELVTVTESPRTGPAYIFKRHK